MVETGQRRREAWRRVKPTAISMASSQRSASCAGRRRPTGRLVHPVAPTISTAKVSVDAPSSSAYLQPCQVTQMGKRKPDYFGATESEVIEALQEQVETRLEQIVWLRKNVGTMRRWIALHRCGDLTAEAAFKQIEI